MQADRFTIKSQEAVAAAQRLASGRRNTEVAPAHLLMALLQQEDGFAAPILQRLDVDVARLREQVHERIDALPTVSGDAEPEVKPSQSFVKALQRAERESAARGNQYISTEDMLLALAGKESGVGDLPTAIRSRRRSARSSAPTL
jgi:ATP-dependent Clp protease ATP-binding subunit ClpB